MSTDKYPPSFREAQASAWRRIRRYAVPQWMIDRAAERREAGDWLGACAAANVDVAFGLTDISNKHGADVADRVEDDLRHFAPDLLRWHAPRYLHGRTTLRPAQSILLSSYSDQEGSARPYLHVTTRRMVEGSQRLTLRYEPVEYKKYYPSFGPMRHDWGLARYLWDTRHTGELREHRTRPANWVTLQQDQGNIAEACAAAGIALNTARATPYGGSVTHLLTYRPIDLACLPGTLRYLSDQGVGERFHINHYGSSILLELGNGLSLRQAAPEDVQGIEPLAEALWRRLPDLDLLRFGHITPEQLHPLVRASLFPDKAPRDGQDGPAAPELPSSVRVRCRGDWHEVGFRDGRLQLPHSAEEEQLEQAMQALGGPPIGCFAAKRAWISGTGRLPKALREQQREFFSRIQHGDTPAVLAMLDAGVNPGIRDRCGRTMLHLLPLIDHGEVLPRLLAAGLDLEARDCYERTPIHVAVGEGPADLVRTLFDAGARIDVIDNNGISLSKLISRFGREDELRFLSDVLRRDHPDLAATAPRQLRRRR